MTVYLDTSAIVKRYILEPGSKVVKKVYVNALNGETTLSFSAWNIGEVFGVLDKYLSRGWLDKRGYEVALVSFVKETIRLIKLRLTKIIPVRTSLLAETWNLINKYHIYEADAIQITSAKHADSEQFLSGDKKLVEISKAEGLNALYLK